MVAADLAPRLRRLPAVEVLGIEARLACGFRARLIGLVALDRREAGAGLLIPRCSCVHTFGMRFELDLCFLDREGGVIESRRAVPARQFAFCRGASAVLELPAATGEEICGPPA